MSVGQDTTTTTINVITTKIGIIGNKIIDSIIIIILIGPIIISNKITRKFQVGFRRKKRSRRNVKM